MGYSQAGFDIVGVDNRPQPKYPFAFIQADALEYAAEHGREFDAVHASPPCQCYTAVFNYTQPRAEQRHPDLLAPTRDLLIATGLPYVIENVPRSPIQANLMLCGTMFRLGTPCGAELRRHRYFEAPWWSAMVPGCDHGWGERVVGIYGDIGHDPKIWRAEKRLGTKGKRSSRVCCITDHTGLRHVIHNQKKETFSAEACRVAMGIDWLSMKELSQAIPPAYTKFIGLELRKELA